MKPRLTFTIILLVLTGSCITLAHAFIGNNLLGRNLCVVGCGRGPLGIAPLGDVIKGANDAVFGPTVDNFEQAGKRVVDYAGTKADEQVKKTLAELQALLQGERKQLDQSFVDRLTDLNTITQDSLLALDDTIRRSLQEGDRLLEARFGSLNTIGVVQLASFEAILHRLVMFSAIVAFIWFVATRLYPDFIIDRKGKAKAIAMKASAGFAMVVVLGFGYLLLPNQKAVDALRTRHGAAYTESIDALDFRAASFHATQLQTIDHFDKDYAFLAEKSSLMRDIFMRPTSYKTIEGLAETEGQLRKLLNPATYKQRDPDIETMFALVLWQVRRDKYTQYLVANACAQVLRNSLINAAGKKSFALAPIALHYLRSYMSSPLSDRDLEILRLNSPKNKGDETDIYSNLFPLQNTAKLTEILEASSQDVVFSINTESPLYSSVSYGSITSKMYRNAISTYFSMANFQASAAAETDAGRAKMLIERRNEMARNLISVWDDWAIAMGEASIDLSVSNRLAILQGIHATYARAVSYAESSTADVAKPTLLEAKLFHTKWLEASIRGFVRPQGYRVLQGLASKAFIEDEAKLVAFENAFVDAKKGFAANSGESAPKARTAALLASELGLFACKTEAYTCASTMLPENAIWLIREQIPATLRPEDVGWNEILKASLSRTVPIQ